LILFKKYSDYKSLITKLYTLKNYCRMYTNVYTYTHGKNDFIEISKNLDRYRSENNFIEQNNYIEISSMMSNAAKILTF